MWDKHQFDSTDLELTRMPTSEPFSPPGLASTHKQKKIHVEGDFGGFLAVVIDSYLSDTTVGPKEFFSVIDWQQ